MKEQMKEQCESPGLSGKIPEDKVYRWELKNLERQLNKLEETVNALTALADVLAKANGIKIDRFKGIVVISTI